MEKLKRIGYILNRVEDALLVTVLSASVLIIFWQVIRRYVFNSSLSWSEEIARFMFIWISWLGISLGQGKGQHISVTLLTDRLKGRLQNAVLVFSDLITFAISLVVLWYGYVVMVQTMHQGTSSAALNIPMYLIFMAVPFSSFLMCARLIITMWRRIKGVYPFPDVPENERGVAS